MVKTFQSKDKDRVKARPNNKLSKIKPSLNIKVKTGLKKKNGKR